MALETILSYLTILSAAAAGAWATFQWRHSTRQRHEDLQWRKAELGRELLDDLFGDESARSLLELIDGERDDVIDSRGTAVEASQEDFCKALLKRKDNSGKARAIRYCMDSFLYHLARLERSVSLSVTNIEDLRLPLEYYAGLLSGRDDYLNAVKPYIEKAHYGPAYRFLERFSNWRPERNEQS